MIKKNKKIAITGLSGVIGKVLSKNLNEYSEIIDLFNHKRSYGSKKFHVKLDLLKKDRIYKVLQKVNPDVIVHMAAKTHIDACEEDKKRGKKGNTWKLNVDATTEIARYCRDYKKFIIFLSTECVFDGKRKFFGEKAKKNPINWYGFTKSEAEDIIMSSGIRFAIVRSVVAYHENDFGKTIYGQILSKLKSKKPVSAVYDQQFTPTHTDDIVFAIKKIIDNNLTGIYHVAPKKSLSPYDFAKIVAKKNNYSYSTILKKDLVSFYDLKRASLRLKNASLSAKVSNKKLGFTPKNPENILKG